MRPASSRLESLEVRRLFVGTEANDVIRVGVIDGDPATCAITVNGLVVEQGPFDLSNPDNYLAIDCRGGDDALTVDPLFAGGVSVSGGDGNDTLFGEAGDDYLEGGRGDDVLLGQADNDRLFGLEGNDVLFSNDGTADTVRGGAGTDRGDADEGDDVLAVEVLS